MKLFKIKNIAAIAVIAIFLLPGHLKAQVSFVLSGIPCIGSTVTVTAITGTDTAISYTWQSIPQGPVFSAANAAVTNISFPQLGNYTITLNVTLSNGSGTYSTAISVNPPLTIHYALSSPTTCMVSNAPVYAKPVTFTVSGASSYSWQALPPILVGPPGNVNIVSFIPTASTCYTITGFTSVCSGSTTACFTVIPQFTFGINPPGGIRCKPDSLTLGIVNIQSNTAGPYTFSWTETPAESGSINNPLMSIVKVSPQNNTTYSVEVRDAESCVSVPAIASVTVADCTGIEANTLMDPGYSVFPNPVKNKLSIETPNGLFAKGYILNAFGQLVQEFNVNGTVALDLESLPAGLYFIHLQSAGGESLHKILKE